MTFTKKELREYMASIGREGGKVGGKSRSEKKLAAVRRNVKKATKARLAKRKKRKSK